MKNEIIETAVSIGTGLIRQIENSEDPEGKSIHASEYKGMYMHNVSGALEDKWLPAVAVSDHFGMTLEELRLQLVKCSDGSSVTAPEEFKEFTPVSIQQIRKLVATQNHDNQDRK